LLLEGVDLAPLSRTPSFLAAKLPKRLECILALEGNVRECRANHCRLAGHSMSPVRERANRLRENIDYTWGRNTNGKISHKNIKISEKNIAINLIPTKYLKEDVRVIY